MSERLQTTDIGLPYQAIPRVERTLLMQPNSHVDLMLPYTANKRARLRLYDVNDRWIRALDLSAYPFHNPEADALLDAPHGAFDSIELDEEFVVGRDHNPDNLPILNRNVVSKNHFSLTVSLGERGILLAIKDLDSYNGTEVIMNNTFESYRPETFSST